MHLLLNHLYPPGSLASTLGLLFPRREVQRDSAAARAAWYKARTQSVRSEDVGW